MKLEILILDITALATKIRVDDQGLITTIKFESKIHPASLARILNLQRQGAPLLVTIGSPQATLDLDIHEEPAQACMPAEKEAQS